VENARRSPSGLPVGFYLGVAIKWRSAFILTLSDVQQVWQVIECHIFKHDLRESPIDLKTRTTIFKIIIKFLGRI